MHSDQSATREREPAGVRILGAVSPVRTVSAPDVTRLLMRLPAGAPDDPERFKSPRRGMAAAVLVLEGIILGLTAPVLVRFTDISPGVAIGIGVGLGLACVLTAGLLRKEWGYGVGWALQVAALALGFLVPAMFFFGAIFAQFIRPGMGAGWAVAIFATLVALAIVVFTAMALGVNAASRFLGRAAPYIDIVAGVVFLCVAVWMIYEGVTG